MTSALLAAVALVGTVLVAVSAVLVQAASNMANSTGYSTVQEIRSAARLRQVHGTVMYGSLVAFTLAGVLIWYELAHADRSVASVIESVVVGVTAHLGLTLLRVLIVADVVMEGLAKRAANRAA